MSTPDPFAHDDAAFVLGALSADERAAFEQHLLTCQACASRVRELAPLPALLAGLPASAYTDEHDDLPASLLPDLLRHVGSERRRRRQFTAGLAGLAAACLVALAVGAWPNPAARKPASGGSTAQAMSAVITSPVHASAQLTAVKWGTKIELACSYDAGYASNADYQLVVIDRQSVAHPAGSWKLTPGSLIHFTGGTSLPRDQISRVEIEVGDQAILVLTV